MPNRFGIGQPVRRVEDVRFITGSGRYVDDLVLPQQLYGQIVLSPHAHARIKKIDVSAAKKAPGVVLALTGADLQAQGVGNMLGAFMPEDMGGPKGNRMMRRILATDKLRHVGDRVAFIVAETAAQARDAAELVDIDVDMLPAVTDLEAAARPGAPLVWDEAQGNLCVPIMMGNKQATDEAFAAAKHAVKVKLVNNRLVANAMEPRGCIGTYSRADDAYTLYTSTQNPHGTRQMLAGMVFHMPETQLRVVANDVGGGFGMKGGVYPEEALVLLAAKLTGRPVRWNQNRTEGFISDDAGRDQIIEAEMALDANGKITGVRCTALHNFGAYVVGAAVVPLIWSVKLMPAVYDIKNVHLATRAIFTNTTPTGPYRGAGRPEASYVIERLIDKAAEASGIDAIELRKRNYIEPGKFPYATPTGFVYDDGDFSHTTDMALELADWKGYDKRVAESRRRGKLRGRAAIYYLEDAGVFNDRMEVRFDPGGGCTIVAGTFSHGQSHATTFAQVVSDWLGIPFESIRLIQGDTNQVPFGRGTYGSRSAVVGTGALRGACDVIIAKGKGFAAHMLEASAADIQFKEGRFEVVGTDKGIGIVDVAKFAYHPAGLPKDLGVGLEGSGTFAPEPPSFPNGCHICELEIDQDTGTVTLDRYVVADDVGRVINPMIVDGQIHGGLAQGIGQALTEGAVFDPSGGQLLSGSFMDYCMPRADDMPDFAVTYNELACKTNPLGVKGCGEAGTVGAPPAVINAILDALKPLGVRHIDMPATPARVWQAIATARAAAE
ncbi:MAG TPA: xanthine dehydrogenase family protein molybdopterin-binding subunit [Stellaceae bacterium]|nr:xanthine dehydrogenase family protein molybdopterin-binding subunit [Stellaceae bacterium]